MEIGALTESSCTCLHLDNYHPEFEPPESDQVTGENESQMKARARASKSGGRKVNYYVTVDTPSGTLSLLVDLVCWLTLEGPAFTATQRD
jgi:hypothetical protein